MSVITPSTDSQDDMSRSRLIYLGNELPNSDLQALFRRLQKHCNGRNHSILVSFLDEATLALRNEIRERPADERAQFPTFETILSLAENPGLGASGAVDGVLLCVFQIATYIGFVFTASFYALQR
jgi:monodictyphenone polyketide synthase